LGSIMFYYSRKYMKFDLNTKFILKSILSSIIMSVIIWILNPIGTIKVLLTIGIGAFAYFILIFLMKGFEKEELVIFSQILGLKRT